MKHSEHTKPISYLKSNTAEMINEVTETRSPYVITQNGYPKAVMQDIKSYEETQESLALLKIIALSKKSAESAKPKTVKQSFKSVRQKVGELKKQN